MDPRGWGKLFDDPVIGETITPELRQIIRYELAEDDGSVQVTTQSNTQTQEKADHSAKNWRVVLEGLKSLVESSL